MKNYPYKIALLYFVVAALWIFVGDGLVSEIIPKEKYIAAQTIKGFAFILITSIGLYFIVRNFYRSHKKSEAEYRKLFKDNPHPMWVYDVQTLKFLTANLAAAEQYKYSIEEFMQLNIMDIRPKEEHFSLQHYITKLQDKAYVDSGVWKHMDKEGRIFYVRVSSHSTTFEGRKARVVLAIDIDDQLLAQKKVEESEAKLHGLINNSDDLIWMIDNEGFIVTANETFREKFRQLLGFEVELSRRIEANQLPDTGFTKNWGGYIQQALQGRHLRVEEVVTNGRTEYFEIVLSPIYDDRRGIFGVGCFARDITKHKEAQNQIKQQVNKLKEVAWIQSHELRKPVANILGLLRLLKDNNDNKEEFNRVLNHMENSCKELDEVVKRIVETSTISKTAL